MNQLMFPRTIMLVYVEKMRTQLKVLTAFSLMTALLFAIIRMVPHPCGQVSAQVLDFENRKLRLTDVAFLAIIVVNHHMNG